jgi:hypothetical protein
MCIRTRARQFDALRLCKVQCLQSNSYLFPVTQDVQDQRISPTQTTTIPSGAKGLTPKEAATYVRVLSKLEY